MRKYCKQDPSIVQPAQTEAPTKLPPYAKTSTRFQLKDHPIYPGLNSSDPMGGVEDEFAKYTSGQLTSCKTDILVYWEVSPASHLIRLAALLQLALPIGPQVGIPYPVCYCHGLPSDPSVFCPMRTHLLISWGDRYQEMKSDQPSLNGGSTNAQVPAEEEASRFHDWLEDLGSCDAGRDQDGGRLSAGNHARFFVG